MLRFRPWMGVRRTLGLVVLSAAQPVIAASLAVGLAVILAAPAAAGPPPLRCGGDCDGNGSVGAGDLVVMVNVSAEVLPLSACEAGDLDASTVITVDEILGAVNNALTDCAMPMPDTPTPTATSGRWRPSRSASPTTSDGRSVGPSQPGPCPP